MKSIVLIFTSLFFLNLPLYLSASEFIISNQIAIKQSPPLLIAHSGELVIFKYKDWSYTHEVISPDKFIASVDLTGFEHQFIESIFESEERESLPNWLALIAEDFADKILNPKGSFQKSYVDNAVVYGTYNPTEQQGIIFVLEKNSIHKLDILGTNKNYMDFFNNIINQ